MQAAIAAVFGFDLPIEATGEQMIYDATPWKALCTDLFEPFELAPEQGCALAPMGARETKKLTRQKVAGMGRDNIEKARFFFGVAERLESVEIGGGSVNRGRVPKGV